MIAKLPALRASLTAIASLLGLLALGGGCTITPAVDEPTACAADDYEPNDTDKTPFELQVMTDEPSTSQELSSLTQHSTLNVDWFSIPIRDTGFRGNPVVTVTGSDPDLYITTWFVCSNALTGSTECRYGERSYDEYRESRVDGCQATSYRIDEPGTYERVKVVTSSTDCPDTSDDDGVLYVRVRRYYLDKERTPCRYALKIAVD